MSVQGLGQPSRVRRSVLEGPLALACAFALAAVALIALLVVLPAERSAEDMTSSWPAFLQFVFPVVIVAQALLGFALLAERGPLPAFSGALALGGLTLLQAPLLGLSWFVLPLLVAMAAVVQWMDKAASGRTAALGALTLLIALCDPVSGFLAFVAVVPLLLCEGPRHTNPSHSMGGARLLLLLATVGLAIFLLLGGSLVGTVMLGFAPLAALIWALRQTTSGRREVRALVGGLLGGALLVVIPAVLYGVANDLPLSWWWSPVGRSNSGAAAVLGLSTILTGGFAQIAALASARSVVEGIFWIALLFAPLALGALLVGHLSRISRGETPAALPWFALFFAPLALERPLPAALLLISSLTLAGLLALAGRRARGRWLAAAAVASIVIVALALPARFGAIS